MQDAHALLAGEAVRFGGRMLPINVTPYVMGLPYRMDAFERLLAFLAAPPDTASHTAGEVASARRDSSPPRSDRNAVQIASNRVAVGAETRPAMLVRSRIGDK